MCLSHMCSTYNGQKRVSDALELELQMVCEQLSEYRKLNPGPLGESLVPLAAEPSPLISNLCHLIFFEPQLHYISTLRPLNLQLNGLFPCFQEDYAETEGLLF